MAAVAIENRGGFWVYLLNFNKEWILRELKIETLQKKNLSEMVFDILREMILNGEMQSGDKIFEEQLAARFGVSRTPIREAIIRLSDCGLVTLNPRTNATVSLISEKEAIDLIIVRFSLERLVVKTLCHSDSVDFGKLRLVARKALESLDSKKHSTIFTCDSAFHNVMAEETGNLTLLNLLLSIDARNNKIRIAQAIKPEGLLYYFRQHLEIIDLIEKKRENEVISALSNHICHDYPIPAALIM